MYYKNMFAVKWIILALFVLMYLFVILFQEKKVLITTITVCVVLSLGIIFKNQVFTQGLSQNGRIYVLCHAVLELINWNILMIYLGSMVIASLFIYSKVPTRIADFLVRFSPNTGIAIILILAMTGIISIFVENVATVLVMAPIALSLSKKMKINPVPFMIGLAVMSNLEGTATLVGDPPSMIFASYAKYNFNDFFVCRGKLSIFFIIQFGLIAGCIFFYCFFAKNREKSQVEKEPVVSVVPFVLLLLLIFGLAVISFFSTELGYASGFYVMILGCIGLIWYKFSQKKDNSEVWDLIKALDWETIFFLINIFVIVGAISETGLLMDFANVLSYLIAGNKLVGFIFILLFSVIISGFIDNVPYIIVMLPIASYLANNCGIESELYLFALLVGSCLGGNLTPFGASANVVAMGILKKEGHPISFLDFLKIGAPFTIITTTVAAVALYLIWA